jgi:hypothetical protein
VCPLPRSAFATTERCLRIGKSTVTQGTAGLNRAISTRLRAQRNKWRTMNGDGIGGACRIERQHGDEALPLGFRIAQLRVSLTPSADAPRVTCATWFPPYSVGVHRPSDSFRAYRGEREIQQQRASFTRVQFPRHARSLVPPTRQVEMGGVAFRKCSMQDATIQHAECRRHHHPV